MKKLNPICIVALTVAMIVSATTVWAAEQAFPIAVSIPAATAVTFTVSKVTGTTWATNNYNLEFGQLDFEPVNKIFTAPFYFAIDLGSNGTGAGVPDEIKLTYSESSNPNSVAGTGRRGLGYKSVVTVAKAIEDSADSVLHKVLLQKVGSIDALDKTSFVGGWPRVYVGIYDGNAKNSSGDADEELFTLEDAPGDYLGVLTITAIVN